jgi:Kef-type K+ transport system membrane component KefB
VSGFGFDTLALLVVLGFAGPLLASLPRLQIPVVLGQLIAGLVVGRAGFDIVDVTNPTFQLFANIGFALVMFVVGTHVRLPAGEMRSVLPMVLIHVVLCGVVAVAFGAGLAAAFGTGHAALYAVLMASSSAALALPVIGALRLEGPQVRRVTTQIAIADTACIVLLPLVIDFQRAPAAALGALAIAGCAAVLFVLLRAVERKGWRHRARKYSKKRRFAMELQISLMLLFSLATLAVHTHVSIMLAGFALGLVLGAAGEPRRLARQLFGITEGFFGPLFFVWLGASLQLRELGSHPKLILLGIALGLGAVLAHSVGRLLGQPLTLAVLSAAQLGVPVAAATIGTEQQLLVNGEASALMLGALLTIATTSISGALAARSQNTTKADQSGGPQKSPRRLRGSSSRAGGSKRSSRPATSSSAPGPAPSGE